MSSEWGPTPAKRTPAHPGHPPSIIGPMILMTAFLVIGLLLGWGLGGGLRCLSRVRVRWWWLAPVALALQVAPFPSVDGELGARLPTAVFILSFLLLAILAAANLRLRGFALILLGVLLNLVVIAANQGMPVSAHALEVLDRQEDIVTLREVEDGSKHHLATGEDVLRPLGDVIAVRRPFDTVVSVGDVLAFGGAAIFLGSAMRGRPARRAREPEPRPAQRATWS